MESGYGGGIGRWVGERRGVNLRVDDDLLLVEVGVDKRCVEVEERLLRDVKVEEGVRVMDVAGILGDERRELEDPVVDNGVV